ncbi:MULTISPECIES: TMEM165/GDT1 family protein [Halolamina]|uniref:Putative Ca2+/H+ antiporter, TMEM165/GDT1 family n=1 Tax=Halolamina pelagica TaxID=699431 RepID=A0A1I5VJL6_9EURY|nr:MULTISPECIES: TMEM165/GDT1 family protein [Halolamina]NHX37636.1 TMEM165/GDT1 family protein [Halolamina sp. R1-12]SFQ07659.1 Putative Ca2+/H+ antiporter, TMEM165/GDT1 family [Halolamina pelagica]
MVGWLDILISAFVLQLLALPGEKGQIVIAALATKYNPYMVVAGAATAFGGWTVLEILLGNALKGALPEVFLDGLTAALFFVFGAWILYTSQLDFEEDTDDEQLLTDGSPEVVDEATDVVPSRFAGFFPSFSLMVFGEFGDKTQLITIGLAVQYGAHPAIWFGEMLAIIPVSFVTALFFSRSSAYINTKWVRYVSASLFTLFGLDIVSKYLFGIQFLPF